MNPGLVLLIFLQVSSSSSSSLDEALRSLEEGQSPPASVGRDVGAAAAARINPLVDEAMLRHLAALARAGRADEPLAASLVGVLADHGGLARPAVALLGELPVTVLPGRAPDPAVLALIELAQEGLVGDDEARVLGVIASRLLGRWAPLDAVVALLGEWAFDEAAHPCVLEVVQQLPANQTARPEDWVGVLSELPAVGPAAWTPAAGEALREMVLRDLPAFDRLLELTSAGTLGPGAAALRALGGAPIDDAERYERARGVVVDYLGAGAAEPEALPADVTTAAVRAAADLFAFELVLLLPDLVQGRWPQPVRIAAVQAIEKLAYRDAPTIDLLIGLLDDPMPDVGIAAFEVLRGKSGQKTIPQRRVLWERWREAVELPAGPPEELEAWIAGQRQVEGGLRRGHRERLEREARRAAARAAAREALGR